MSFLHSTFVKINSFPSDTGLISLPTKNKTRCINSKSKQFLVQHKIHPNNVLYEKLKKQVIVTVSAKSTETVTITHILTIIFSYSILPTPYVFSPGHTPDTHPRRQQ